QFLLMCIRALDYCPPVDLNFGDYLRALITADYDLVPDDPWGYRIAIAESFRRRGIFPLNIRTFGEETLRWLAPESHEADALFEELCPALEQLASDIQRVDPGPGYRGIPERGARKEIFRLSRGTRIHIHRKLAAGIKRLKRGEREKVGRLIGLDFTQPEPVFEVHTVAVADRQGPAGRVVSQFVLTFVQDRKFKHGAEELQLWSGATILLERGKLRPRFIIRKSAQSARRR